MWQYPGDPKPKTVYLAPPDQVLTFICKQKGFEALAAKRDEYAVKFMRAHQADITEMLGKAVNPGAASEFLQSGQASAVMPSSGVGGAAASGALLQGDMGILVDAIGAAIGKHISPLSQQITNVDTKLTKQANEMDAKFTKQADEMDAKLTQQANNMDTKLSQQANDTDAKIAGMQAGFQTIVNSELKTIQQEIKEIKEKGITNKRPAGGAAGQDGSSSAEKRPKLSFSFRTIHLYKSLGINPDMLEACEKFNIETHKHRDVFLKRVVESNATDKEKCLLPDDVIAVMIKLEQIEMTVTDIREAMAAWFDRFSRTRESVKGYAHMKFCYKGFKIFMTDAERKKLGK